MTTATLIEQSFAHFKQKPICHNILWTTSYSRLKEKTRGSLPSSLQRDYQLNSFIIHGFVGSTQLLTENLFFLLTLRKVRNLVTMVAHHGTHRVRNRLLYGV